MISRILSLLFSQFKAVGMGNNLLSHQYLQAYYDVRRALFGNKPIKIATTLLILAAGRQPPNFNQGEVTVRHKLDRHSPNNPKISDVWIIEGLLSLSKSMKYDSVAEFLHDAFDASWAIYFEDKLFWELNNQELNKAYEDESTSISLIYLGEIDLRPGMNAEGLKSLRAAWGSGIKSKYDQYKREVFPKLYVNGSNVGMKCGAREFMRKTGFGKNAITGSLTSRKVTEVSTNLIKPLLANYRKTGTQQKMEFSSKDFKFKAKVVLK